MADWSKASKLLEDPNILNLNFGKKKSIKFITFTRHEFFNILDKKNIVIVMQNALIELNLFST